MHKPIKQPSPDVSVVVPVYGTGGALGELRSRLATVLGDAGIRHELILVDDRGDDAAWPVIAALAASFPEVVGLRLGRNFGQHAATLCGIAEASGRWIVTMDDDLEHQPEAVPALLAAGDGSHPLVYGAFPSRTHSGYRNLSSNLMRWALKKSFPDMNASYSSFRAIDRKLAAQLAAFQFYRPYIDGMLSWLTSSVRTVEVEHGERGHGRSGYTLGRLFSHAINVFVTFSRLPLRFATYSGIGLALLSFASLLYIVYGKLSGQIDSPGYASLMSVVLLTCAIQLILLGVVGEYVGRLMGVAHHKPVYVLVDRAEQAGAGVTEQ
jgi:polyisoprenyl-phosphate glycosyltransferase